MDVFKITPGYQEIHKISEATFTEETKLVPPYKEGNSYRAVCPECDNPIILVGLFKPTPESGRKPYGRHHKGSISELAVYREDEYENCIYANPSWKKSKVKRSANSEAGKVLLRIMREQFDRIVYILEKSIEIKISKSFAEKMLTCYLDAEGWLYYDSTAYNLPFKLLQSSGCWVLYGRGVQKGDGLYNALSAYGKVLLLDNGGNFVTVKTQSGTFADIRFLVTNHKKTLVDGEAKEFITLSVFEGVTSKAPQIYRKEMEIQKEWLLRLMNLPESRSRRNLALLEIAEKLYKQKQVPI